LVVVDVDVDVVEAGADVVVPSEARFELLEQAAAGTARQRATVRLRPNDLVLFLMTSLSSDFSGTVRTEGPWSCRNSRAAGRPVPLPHQITIAPGTRTATDIIARSGPYHRDSGGCANLGGSR
jgi:hypothetical protein